jgi:hypothetical protein
MKREEIKTYKDACKVIGRKPRTYKDKHLNLYEQLSTIIAALNFISNDNKPWTPKFNYCCIYSWLYKEYEYNKSAGLFYLASNYELDSSDADVGASLKIKERGDGNYIIENFKELLQDWFWGD